MPKVKQSFSLEQLRIILDDYLLMSAYYEALRDYLDSIVMASTREESAHDRDNYHPIAIVLEQPSTGKYALKMDNTVQFVYPLPLVLQLLGKDTFYNRLPKNIIVNSLPTESNLSIIINALIIVSRHICLSQQLHRYSRTRYQTNKPIMCSDCQQCSEYRLDLWYIYGHINMLPFMTIPTSAIKDLKLITQVVTHFTLYLLYNFLTSVPDNIDVINEVLCGVNKVMSPDIYTSKVHRESNILYIGHLLDAVIMSPAIETVLFRLPNTCFEQGHHKSNSELLNSKLNKVEYERINICQNFLRLRPKPQQDKITKKKREFAKAVEANKYGIERIDQKRNKENTYFYQIAEAKYTKDINKRKERDRYQLNGEQIRKQIEQEFAYGKAIYLSHHPYEGVMRSNSKPAESKYKHFWSLIRKSTIKYSNIARLSSSKKVSISQHKATTFNNSTRKSLYGQRQRVSLFSGSKPNEDLVNRFRRTYC